MEPATPDRSSATNHEINPAAPTAPAAPKSPVAPVAPVAPGQSASPMYQQYATAPNAVESGDGIAPSAPWPGAFAAIGMVFRQLKKNPQPALIILAVYALLSVIGLVIGGGNQVTHDSSYIQSTSKADFSRLGTFIFLLAQPVYALALADRKKISIGEFFKADIGAYFKIFGASLIVGVMLTLAAIPILIPLIWIVPWIAFYAYTIIDKGVGPLQSISESKALGRHNKGKVWGIVGTSIVLNLVGLILLFIPGVGVVAGDLVSSLVSIVGLGALAILYRWIQQNQSQTPGAAPGAAGIPGPPLPPISPTPPVAPTPPQPPVAPTPPAV